MRQSRIYTPQTLRRADSIELEGPASHYLSRVLRLSEGDTVTVFNGDGFDYPGEICGLQCQRVQLNLGKGRLVENESPLKITLVQAISRGERMDYSLQKATELGVFCIQPVTSRRVEVRLDEKRRSKRLSHWQGVVISACEQCGRAVVPEVKTPISLDAWVAAVDEFPRLVLDPAAVPSLSTFTVNKGAVSLLVGSEGGFSVEELQNLYAKGVFGVSLGPRILRTESAGPAAIAILQAGIGDM